MSADPAPEVIFGSTVPRVYTSPLVTGAPGECGCGCALSRATSYGFAVADFAAELLEMPLDPWQRWLVIHAGEMLPDGRPRFRTVLVLISRQQGKTRLGVVLTLYWLFLESQREVLGTSTNRDTAKESWREAVRLARENPELGELIRPPRYANGEETLETLEGCRYKIAASNSRGGRGRTINRLILDELREHHSMEAVDAAVPATNAVPTAQIWALTNQGGDDSVVLRDWHAQALAWITTGTGDRRLGLFEWSAPPGSAPDDVEALAMANPSLGIRTDLETLLGDARRAKATGGAALASFRTEIMCMRVDRLDPAVDPAAWEACATVTTPLPADQRGRVALCLDVSLDGQHATLMSAVLIDGTVRLETVAQWEGTRMLRERLPGIVARVKPAVIGWMPNGPAASVAADLAERRRGASPWPPRGVKLEEIRSDLAAVSMGFAELVAAGQVSHPGDDMLNAHVAAAQRARRGDAWVFGRRDSGGPIDALYAAAGAAHLARTLPPPRPPLTAL